jgi:ParB-like chromosome segregation protein Spo0J
MMARLKDIAKVKDAFSIPLDLLEPGENIREDFSGVPDRAVSMFNMGQLTPIKVRLSEDGEKAIISDGGVRYRAAHYVNAHYDEWTKDGHEGGFRFESLLCVSEPKDTSPITRIVQQIESNTHIPLTPLERAKAYKKLLDADWSYNKIAKYVGKSAQHVSDYIGMLQAPRQIQEAVEDGKMSATAAITAVKSPEMTAKASEQLSEGKEVQVKDVAEYKPMTMKQARAAIKKATSYFDVETSKEKRARWEGVIHGIEVCAGLRPVEF